MVEANCVMTNRRTVMVKDYYAIILTTSVRPFRFTVLSCSEHYPSNSTAGHLSPSRLIPYTRATCQNSFRYVCSACAGIICLNCCEHFCIQVSTSSCDFFSIFLADVVSKIVDLLFPIMFNSDLFKNFCFCGIARITNFTSEKYICRLTLRQDSSELHSTLIRRHE